MKIVERLLSHQVFGGRLPPPRASSRAVPEPAEQEEPVGAGSSGLPSVSLLADVFLSEAALLTRKHLEPVLEFCIQTHALEAIERLAQHTGTTTAQAAYDFSQAWFRCELLLSCVKAERIDGARATDWQLQGSADLNTALERRRAGLEQRQANALPDARGSFLRELEQLNRVYDHVFDALLPPVIGSVYGLEPGDPDNSGTGARTTGNVVVRCRCERKISSREKYSRGSCRVCRDSYSILTGARWPFHH